MTEKRFYYDYKTGRMKDTQSNSQATKDMRVLETIINDACYSYEKKIKELQERNNRQAKTIDSLYSLIESKDWKGLTAIIDEMNEAEEHSAIKN